VASPIAKAQMAAFGDAVTFLLEGVGKYIRDFASHGIQDQDAFSRWNSTMPPRLERCVHDLVRDKMVTQPSVLAISAWDGEMTYGELDDASRRLAHHLAGRGVGPEVMIGLCMDKSKWAVVAMLAILRAGGAVVPLGSQHPLARIEGIVQDTAAPLLLVDRDHEQRLAALATHTQLLAVDCFFNGAPATAAATRFTEPCTSVRPDHVAWVIYTSGSTGKPKGVVLEHGALATSILAHGPAIGIQSHDRLSQFAAHTFDVAIAEIMTTLSFGACICVPSENDRINRLTPFLSEANITIATLTSTVAALVQPHDTPTIRTLILTGEAVQPKVVDQWVQQATVMNAYGPSESSIWTTGNKIQNKSEATNIGKPLAGGFWVVNPANIGQLVPLGAPGELLIEGPLLARGYLNDPAKTAAAFVTDPAFVQQLGLSASRRMYRTGDIVQQNADGSLTYLGRRDTQVKIRGQRVEIGEIESHIVRLLPDAREAIVDVV
ncbi:amino acid adenylation, partial [Lojkania enalia]